MSKYYVRITPMKNGSTVILVGNPEDEEMGGGHAVGTGVDGKRPVLFAFLAALGSHDYAERKNREFTRILRNWSFSESIN